MRKTGGDYTFAGAVGFMTRKPYTSRPYAWLSCLDSGAAAMRE